MVFRRRNQERQSSQPQPEAEASDENGQNLDEVPLTTSNDRPGIADKVRFWEEQDRINQELIPRVLKQHELLSAHIASHEESRVQTAAIDSRIRDMNESHIRAVTELEQRTTAEIRSTKRLALLISCASVVIATLAIILALVA